MLYEWLNDPQRVAPWDHFEVESYRTSEDSLHRASEDASSLAPRFLIIRKGASPIGMVGYFASYRALDTTDVWYVVMDIAERGKGYGREAVQLLVDYLFSHTHVNRVGATSDVANAASKGLLLSLGFREEGRLIGALFHHGEWHDVMVFGKTRAEWELEG